jgi:hypothetical protein
MKVLRWDSGVRRVSLVLIAGLALLGTAAFALQAQSGAAEAFEKLKALEGQRVGKMPDGMPVTTSFHVTAGGSAVLQMLGEGTEHEMPTLFHMDGTRLMATHYCAAKNQPRMVLAPGAGFSTAMRFQCLDATNLANPEDGHMHAVTMTFPGPDRLRQEWTYRQNGKETVEAFEFERKR